MSRSALAPLLAPFADENVGAVTGRPFSSSPRDTMLGYWSHLLVEGAHQTAKPGTLPESSCSALATYLPPGAASSRRIPEDALAEDAVISHRIAEQGFKIRYAPEAAVFVKYPTNYADWLRQKVRSAGGYAQSYVRNSPFSMRSARLEAQQGTLLALKICSCSPGVCLDAAAFCRASSFVEFGFLARTGAETAVNYSVAACRKHQVTLQLENFNNASVAVYPHLLTGLQYLWWRRERRRRRGCHIHEQRQSHEPMHRQYPSPARRR